MGSLLIRGLICAVMLVGLPLAGIVATGAEPKAYLEFPPLTRYVEHAPFDAMVFALIAFLDLLMLTGLFHLLGPWVRRPMIAQTTVLRGSRLPRWGWLGILVMAVGWVLAWTRLWWFEPLQRHTFCLPWIGYILLVNAMSYRRTGSSLMTDSPVRFILLWPASALFWWFFEYLNRFVQNWYYVGVDDFSALAYAFHASLAFATVLPAVLSTQHFLLTFSRFNQGLNAVAPIRLPQGKTAAALTLAASGMGLASIGPLSDYLYPLVWAAPLVVITSLQALWRRPTLFAGLRTGDWRSVVSAALAALICGFFWELWNINSLARWEYSIPFVDHWRIFAMPLLGYGGYLPFGLECLLVGQWVMGQYGQNPGQ